MTLNDREIKPILYLKHLIIYNHIKNVKIKLILLRMYNIMYT